jgi:hypothetical protein
MYILNLPEVIVVQHDISPEAFGAILDGQLPEGSVGMTFKEYSAIGRVADCDCGLIECVCKEARQHSKDCAYRFAMTCAVTFPCKDHGLDACIICDHCTCEI